jgi:hypothetical protein
VAQVIERLPREYTPPVQTPLMKKKKKKKKKIYIYIYIERERERERKAIAKIFQKF